MSPNDVKNLIEQGIPGSRAMVSGEGCNLSVTVVSDAFEGKSPVQEQKMVYATVNALIASGQLHALGIKALTNAEWKAAGNS
jgi:acid stress-induced BolA-like protein IbaG/YrbA